MQDFFCAVDKLVETELQNGFLSFKIEIDKAIKSKGLNLTSNQVENDCAQLFQRTKQNFLINVGKFHLYAARNLIVQNDGSVERNSEESLNGDLVFHDNSNLDKTLDRLRTQYQALQADYIHYASECRDMDALLKDMRTSLFNLRVAIQSFDDYEIQPLSETTQILNQYQSQLHRCGQEAEAILDRASVFYMEQKVPRKQLIHEMTKEGSYVPPSHGEGDSSHGEYASQGIPMTEEGAEKVKEFVPSKGLTTFEAQQLLQKWGRNELEDKKKSKLLIFLEQLWQPMPVMIWIAAITEAGIQNWPDMAILLAIQFINAGLGYYEITKAGDAVAALKKSLKPLATVKRDGKWSNIDAAEVVPGDLVLLAAGSAIPADCLVNEGTIDVDQAALTGESLPVTMYKGSSCKMGSNVVRGEVEGTVEYTGSNTFFGKTASLLQGDDELGNLQKVLLNIVIVLVVLSFLFSGIVFAYLLAEGEDLEETISFTVVLIIASIPVAIEIVCTTTLALGSKELSKQGAIVTRLAAIEDMAGMTMLCSDKTGTLTMNKMMIQEETPVYWPGETQYSILRYAAMAAKWHEPARDALDTMVLGQADLKSLDSVEQLDYMPFDPVVKRTEGTVKDKKTGKTFKTTKGAPHVLLKLVTDEKVKHKCEHDVTSFGARGIRCLAVARTDDNGEWKMLGLLTFLDPPRHDTKDTIHRAMAYGVEVKMITGDHLLIAMETARMLDLGDKVEGRPGVVPLIRGAEGLPMLDPVTKKAPDNLGKQYGDYIRNGHGFAQVFPEHKFLIVQCLRELGFKTGMTGDGVNDAPALKRADVGIAVAGATDAARAASDIVLTQEGLSTIVEGIIISRCIFQRMKNFITYRIAATLQLLIFFFIAVLSMKPSDYMPSDWQNTAGFDSDAWPDYFKLPVLMLMLITLLNDGTLISIGYDNVTPSKYPNSWNLPVLFLVAAVLAGVALFSSLLILYWSLDSWTDGSLFKQLGIGDLSYGQITTIMYLKVSISDFLTLFSARTHDGFFWSSRPSPILLVAAIFSLSLSTILACFWPTSHVDNQYVVGLANRHPKEMALFVWLYCIFWWFVQDTAKVVLYWWMEKYNIFQINDSLHLKQAGDQTLATEKNPMFDEEKGSLQKKLLSNH